MKSNKRIKYDILKPTPKGSLTLTRDWMKRYLDAGPDDLVLQVNPSEGVVILSKLKIEDTMDSQLKTLLKGLE